MHIIAFELKVAINKMGPRPNVRHFAVDIINLIVLDENCRICIQILLKFVCRYSINNSPALAQIMGLRRTSDKPLYKQMV